MTTASTITLAGVSLTALTGLFYTLNASFRTTLNAYMKARRSRSRYLLDPEKELKYIEELYEASKGNDLPKIERLGRRLYRNQAFHAVHLQEIFRKSATPMLAAEAYIRSGQLADFHQNPQTGELTLKVDVPALRRRHGLSFLFAIVLACLLVFGTPLVPTLVRGGLLDMLFPLAIVAMAIASMVLAVLADSRLSASIEVRRLLYPDRLPYPKAKDEVSEASRAPAATATRRSFRHLLRPGRRPSFSLQGQSPP